MSKNDTDVRHFTVSREKDIDLVNMFYFFREYFVTLMVAVLIGVMGAAAIYAYLPNKWQADVTLEIGKIPVLDHFDYIDVPDRVVEKIKSPLFLERMVSKIYGNNLSANSRSAQLFYKDLKATVDSTSHLVTIQVFGWSAEKAYESAGILANSIVAEHREMAESYLRVTQKHLTEVAAELEQNHAMLAKLNALEQSSPPKTEANALLKLALVDARVNRIQKLQEERAKLEELVSTARLQATHIVGRSLPPQAPTSPKLGLLIAGGALLGLLCGVLISLAAVVRRSGLRALVGV